MIGRTNVFNTKGPASDLQLTVSGYTGTYDAASHTITATVASSLASTTTIEYSTNNSTWSTTKPTRTNAGTTTVYVRAVNDKYETATANCTIVVNPAAVTLTANSGTKTYSGSSQSVTGFTSSVSGLTFSGVSASGSGTNAGSYSVTFTGVTVNTTKDSTGNYVVTGVNNGTLTIGKLNVTVTLKITSASYTYNGSSRTLTHTFSSSNNLYTSSMCTVTGGSISRTAAGSTTSNIQGSNNNANFNVTFSITNGTLTINPAAVTLTANSGTKTYSGSSQSVTGFTCSVSGLTFSGVSASGSGTNAGTYTVSFSGVTVNTTKDSTGNYVVTKLNTGTLTINKASTMKVTVTGWSGAFDGEAHTVTVSCNVTSGTSYKYSTNNSTWVTTKPTFTTGTNTVYVQAINNNYNTSTGNAKVTIDSSAGAVLFSASSAARVEIYDWNGGSDYLYAFNIPAGNTILTGFPPGHYWALNATAGLWISSSFYVYAGERATLSW